MMDLIERQALMKEFSDFVRESNNSDFAQTPTWNDAVSLVGSMPSAHPELDEWCTDCKEYDKEHHRCPRWNCVIRNTIDELKTQQPVPQWILCSERLPEDNSAVIVTWVNRNPSTYYSEVKDIPFTATAHYDSGKWWWDSCTCQEYLDEYHESPADDVHEDIEMLAWMPLPEPARLEEPND